MSLHLGVDVRELAAGRRTGIGRYVREVLRAAAARGWRVTAYGDAATDLGDAPESVALTRLGAPGTRWWDQVALPRALARDGAHALLSPYYKGPLLAPCPVVITVHDLYFIGYAGRRSVRDAALTAAARLYARRARAIVADSEHSRRAAIALLRVTPAKVTAIPVALGPEFAPTELSDAARARYGITGAYALYIGNFMPHKNVDGLLRAWASLPATLRAGHRLVLAGGDVARRPALQMLARALDVAATVHFPGRIDDADLPGLYSQCAALVLPSLQEGFGLPAIEAMACGAAVIVSDRGALPETAGPGAAVVDIAAEGALAAALARTLLDADYREGLRRRGSARARDFTAGRTAGRVLDLLDGVVHGGTPVAVR